MLGEDLLPASLAGQLEWEVFEAPFFLEAAIILPRHGALLIADAGGWGGREAK